MVKVDTTYEETKKNNLKIADIIDETIEEWGGKNLLTFFKHKNSDPNEPYNRIYSDKNQGNKIFEGKLHEVDCASGKARFNVLDKAYFDWAMEVSKKTEERLGLEVTLKKLYC